MVDNPLGKSTAYPDKYSPDSLYPIPRWPSRSLLDIDKKLLMYGFDRWRAYELSWLNPDGKPETAIGEFLFDARSANMVESKSLKLYLNSLNNERFKDHWEFGRVVTRDLTRVSASEVTVVVHRSRHWDEQCLREPDGLDIDSAELAIVQFTPEPGLLQLDEGEVQDETLISNVFRSNCPVTGQPDWASCVIRYSGQRIQPESVLRYLCSFRQHQGYHEECAELMFRDLMLACRPRQLLVALNFTRRGGLEINPCRSTYPVSPEDFNYRFARQ